MAMASERVAVILALAAVLAGGSPVFGADKPKISPTIIPNFNLPDLSAANNAYKMSSEELAYDCKKLTGHARIRIRQLRSTRADTPTSGLARGMQHAATPLIGGTLRGIDPGGDNARDLAMLKVYNARLGEKSCPQFDLERLLAPGNTEEPRPVAKDRKAPPALFKAARPAPTAPAATTASPSPAKP